MSAYKPANRALRPAVVAAEDYLLAVLYSDYTGGRDTRWESYISGTARSQMLKVMAEPFTTTESFVGTIRVWHMFAARFSTGQVDVSACIDVAGTKNTDLATGAILPDSDQPNAREDDYDAAYILARLHGHWRVVTFGPQVNYPQAVECKP
jgi:hypothetical protein